MFVKYSCAFLILPGFGTLDDACETLVQVQTHKIPLHRRDAQLPRSGA